MKTILVIQHGTIPVHAVLFEDEEAAVAALQDAYEKTLINMSDESLQAVDFKNSGLFLIKEDPRQSSASITFHNRPYNRHMFLVPVGESLPYPTEADTGNNLRLKIQNVVIQAGDKLNNIPFLENGFTSRNDILKQATVRAIRKHNVVLKDDMTGQVYCLKPDQLGGEIWEET